MKQKVVTEKNLVDLQYRVEIECLRGWFPACGPSISTDGELFYQLMLKSKPEEIKIVYLVYDAQAIEAKIHEFFREGYVPFGGMIKLHGQFIQGMFRRNNEEKSADEKALKYYEESLQLVGENRLLRGNLTEIYRVADQAMSHNWDLRQEMEKILWLAKNSLEWEEG